MFDPNFWAGFGLCYVMAGICVSALIWADDPGQCCDSADRLTLVLCGVFWPLAVLVVLWSEPSK